MSGNVVVIPRGRTTGPIPFDLRLLADAIERGEVQAESCVVLTEIHEGFEARRYGPVPRFASLGALIYMTMGWIDDALD